MRKEAREEKKKKHPKPSSKKAEQRIAEPLPTPKKLASSSEMKPKKKQKIEATPFAAADPEDEEIERLERLLGVSGKGDWPLFLSRNPQLNA
jgi:hypothetical protein